MLVWVGLKTPLGAASVSPHAARAVPRFQRMVLGVGSRFSGVYFITDTTHTIDDRGYTTRFNARRESDAQGGSS